MKSTYHGISIPGGAGAEVFPSKEWMAIVEKCRCAECEGWMNFWLDHFGPLTEKDGWMVVK